MFERPLLYLVPSYATALLLAVGFGFEPPAPFLWLALLSLLLFGSGLAVRHRRLFTVLAMLCAAAFALVQLSLYTHYIAQPIRELCGRSTVIRATVLEDASVYDDAQRAELLFEPNRYAKRSFRTLCYLPLTETPLCAGDRIEAHVTFYLPGNTGGFDRARYLAADGVFISATFNKDENGDAIKSIAFNTFVDGKVKWSETLDSDGNLVSSAE